MPGIDPHVIESCIQKAFHKLPMRADLIQSWQAWLDQPKLSMLEETEAFRRYGARRWDEIEESTVIKPFASIHELPHNVFDYYLPRFLLVAISKPYEVVFECLCARFVHRSYHFQAFDSAQKECIRLTLRFHLENECFGDISLRRMAETALRKLDG